MNDIAAEGVSAGYTARVEGGDVTHNEFCNVVGGG